MKKKEPVMEKKDGYYIRRTNLSCDGEEMIIGMRGITGYNAVPYDSKSAAEAGAKRQRKQDEELCPECAIIYEVFKRA